LEFDRYLQQKNKNKKTKRRILFNRKRKRVDEFSMLIKFLGVLLLCAVCVHAWGAPGHRMVGRIAHRYYYNEAVRDAVSKLLNGSTWWSYDEEFPQGRIVAPDPYSRTKEGRWFYDAHFVYSDHRPYYDEKTDCVNTCDSNLEKFGYCTKGQALTNCCAAAAIDKYRDEMWLELIAGEKNASACAGNGNTGYDVQQKARLMAHAIGDIHQPLHASMIPDLGANLFYVKWFGNATCGHPPYESKCSLHKVFDRLIIDKRLLDFGPPPPYGEEDPREAKYAQYIIDNYDKLYLQLGYNYLVEAWTSESIQISAMNYLRSDQGFNVDQAYYEAALPIIEVQLFKAGRRLAQILDFLFGRGDDNGCAECHWRLPICMPVESNTTAAIRRR
jgi:S1/P1 Nuclease